MVLPLPVNQLVEEWLQWAIWQASPENKGRLNGDLIGFDEFDWVVREHPEHAWQGILATLADARAKPYLNILAAGPLEGLLSYHGPQFIDRVGREAACNPQFASLLGGVWQFEMSDQMWARVQSAAGHRG
jgi:hypothetical protein